MMTSWSSKRLHGPLEGVVQVPGDKSVSHRALILSALSTTKHTISGLSENEDVNRTKDALIQMGVPIQRMSSGTFEIQGVGLRGFKSPNGDIDCGNSGTSMRLLAGLLAAQHFPSRLVGDASLSKRPMKRIVEPLRRMGAQIEGVLTGDNVVAPLDILPPVTGLKAVSFELAIASAQVKSAILLAGLYAQGTTIVIEPRPSRDHTETMLQNMRAPLFVDGNNIRLNMIGSESSLIGRDVDVPGDPSSAVFALVGSLLGRSTNVVCKQVGLWQRRLGFVDVIRRMGAELSIAYNSNHSLGSIKIANHPNKLNGTVVEGDLALRAIDEIPILALLASRCAGETRFKDLGELRFKEGDRISSTTALLNGLGVKTMEKEDGFVVYGETDRVFNDAEIHAHGDHRLAMTALVAGFFSSKEVVVHGVDTIASSYKRFREDMNRLGACIEVC